MTQPLKYDESKVRRRLPVVFVILWIYSIVAILPDYILSGVDDGHCILKVFDEMHIGMIVYSFWLLGFLLIPAVVMIATYVLMYRTLSYSTSELSTSSTREKNMKAVQANVIQTCVIVCIFFITTMTYSFTCDALIIHGVLPEYNSVPWNIGVIGLSLNSSINPFVYTIRYVSLRLRVMLYFREISPKFYIINNKVHNSTNH